MGSKSVYMIVFLLWNTKGVMYGIISELLHTINVMLMLMHELKNYFYDVMQYVLLLYGRLTVPGHHPLSLYGKEQCLQY